MEAINWWWLAYPLLGVLVGFMAGLLGVGGGLITVPLLLFINQAQGMSESHLYKIVLASSMAAMTFTSFSSMRSHHRQGNIDWVVVKSLVPGLLIGAMLGGMLSAQVPDRWLAAVFIAFALYTSMQMFFNWKVAAHRTLPSPMTMMSFASLVGALSAMISAGGGFLVVPFLSWCNVAMKRAIAISAACGFPISVFGALGYLISGWNVPDMPAHTLGWIHWPSALGIAITSIFFARMGANLSSQLPVGTLKRIFAFLLMLIAATIFKRYFL